MSRHGVWSLLAFAVLACQDGQSGSENNDPKPPFPEPVPPGIPGIPHCPCGTTGGQSPIRARVVAAEAFPEVGQTRYRLVAEELFGETPGVAVGDEFGGYFDGGLPCGGEATIAIGDQVLALYTRGHQDGASCCEYLACSTECEPVTSDDNPAYEACQQACAHETATACAAHADEARLRGTLVLAPWGEQIPMGHSGSVTATIDASDVPALALERDECEAALDDLFPGLHEGEPSEPPPGAGPTATPPPTAPGALPQPPATTPAPPTTPPPPATTPSGTPTPPVNPGTPSGGPGVAHPEEVRVRCATP